MPETGNSWVNDWGQRSNNALAVLNAYKRQINCDINARQRMIRNAQRQSPNIEPRLERIIRAPLTGLR